MAVVRDWSALSSFLASIDAMTAATVAIAGFAAVQVIREIVREVQRRATLRRGLKAKAWLARRSCEVTLRSAPGIPNPYAVAMRFTASPGLDRLQRHFEQMLALSSALGGDEAQHGERAFGAFLAAADRFGEMMSPTTPATAQVSGYPAMCEQALGFLYDAAVELEHLAPRQPHEPALPARSTLRRLPTPPPEAESPAVAPAGRVSGSLSQGVRPAVYRLRRLAKEQHVDILSTAHADKPFVLAAAAVAPRCQPGQPR